LLHVDSEAATMTGTEPLATALFLTTFGLLLALSIVFSRAAERFAVPVALVFMIIGVLAGSEGIGGIAFEDYEIAFRLGTIALVLILFDGGLHTPMDAVREAARPAGVLATLGVIATTVLVAAAARALGFSWNQALVLGAVVSSTDAAAVFSILRGSGLHLKRRVGITLEVESGINDPVAVMLTTALTAQLVGRGNAPLWELGLDAVVQMVVGAALGIAFGHGGRWLLRRVKLPGGGLYPALTLGLAFLAFGVPTMLHGSGFLAVYIAALILGDGPLPYRAGLLRVHHALAWLGQVVMFLVLGLLVFPSRLFDVAGTGLLLAIFLAVIARPLVVALCLAPFAFRLREVTYVGWVGLRGAVPIILSTIPVLAGAPGALRIFDVVFFIVVVNALVPGATVGWVTRRLGLGAREAPSPPAVLEIESMQPLNGELMSFYIDEALAVTGVTLADLPFPDGASVAMIVRGQDVVPPKGNTAITAGDHVYVFARSEDRPLIHLMFGRAEGD
jgi:cell volume regulation protein A